MNPAPSKDSIPVVKNGCLPWRDCPHWVHKNDADRAQTDGLDACGFGRMAISNLNRATSFARTFYKPVHSGCDEVVFVQGILVVGYDDRRVIKTYRLYPATVR